MRVSVIIGVLPSMTGAVARAQSGAPEDPRVARVRAELQALFAEMAASSWRAASRSRSRAR